ncbi:TraB/GumN family protein [Methanofollis aquaemaris]|uniref:TraB/GumN family protein n=1 Tax=Methanofollis aquaemaris TaxID=126734 RepID=A0A8A3S7T4_9EURY|nr:TraB/GumN family protein [Methanofollis aquaemaris]QSZ67993.1 TraB/GumN family protein [Methanofollis aquaemaris]
MGEIRLVGTAHVSEKSITEVRAAIEEFEPDIVGVELDAGRYQALRNGAPPPKVDEVLKGGNFSQILFQWTLAYLQRKIGMDVGVEPGAEMMAAIDEVENRGLPLGLIDRDIRITLSRFWEGMSLWEKVKMLYALAVSVSGGADEKVDIDALTRQDVVSAALEEFRNFSPNGARALIDERDAFIARRILDLSVRYEKVLAVVGAGHVRGVERYLSSPDLLPPEAALTAAPKKRYPWGKIIGILVVALFALLLISIAFSGVGLEVLAWAILYWVLINGVLAAGFTIAAGGHPLSALTAFGVAWMTSLNPLMAAGWFAAIVEAKIRKPSAADFQQIMDAETFTEMRKVPIFRVVLVAALANVGSTIGTFAYFLFIAPILGIDPTVIIPQGFANFVGWLGGLLPF